MVKLKVWCLTIALVALSVWPAAAATLQFWTPVWNAAVQTWLHETTIPAFEKENPGTKVEVMYGTWDSWSDKLAVAYAGGTFPDVYVIHAEAPRLHVKLGWPLPLDSYIARWPDVKDYIPVAMASAKIDGKQYGIPWSVQGPLMMMWRSAALEAGLPDTIPATWSDFNVAARRMNQITDNRVTRRGYAPPTDQQFMNWVHSNGGDLFTPDFRQAIINKPQAVEALTYLVELMQALLPSGISAVGTDFQNKLVAIKEQEPTFIGTLQQVAPEKIEDLAVGPTPKSTDHVVRVYVPNLAIGSQTKNPELAWRWIEFLQREDNLVTYNSLFGRLSPRTSHLRHRYLRDVHQRTQILQVYSQYGIPHANWPAQEFALMRKPLQQALNQAFAGAISPQAALDEVARAWQVELDAIYGGK